MGTRVLVARPPREPLAPVLADSNPKDSDPPSYQSGPSRSWGAGPQDYRGPPSSPSHTRTGAPYVRPPALSAPSPESSLDATTILPLQEVASGDTPGIPFMVYKPFSTSHLYNWKLQNPVICLLETVFHIHQPTWEDCQQLLQTVYHRGVGPDPGRKPEGNSRTRWKGRPGAMYKALVPLTTP